MHKIQKSVVVWGLAVLDRDYLTVPADQIKDITAVMTIVGGRLVHDERARGQVGSRTEPGVNHADRVPGPIFLALHDEDPLAVWRQAK